MTRLIDADALVARLKEFQPQTSKVKLAQVIVNNIPIVKTKTVKYYDEDENVWKIGSVIVDAD